MLRSGIRRWPLKAESWPHWANKAKASQDMAICSMISLLQPLRLVVTRQALWRIPHHELSKPSNRQANPESPVFFQKLVIEECIS